MKKTILFGLLVAMLVLTVPVAAEVKEPVGENIAIWPDMEIEFPSNTPFHISHGLAGGHELGVGDEPAKPTLNHFELVLTVDGVVVEEDYIDQATNRVIDPDGNDWLLYSKLFVYNFPEGLTGTHTFTVDYYVACQDVMAVSDCPNPKTPVLFLTKTGTVIFTP